MNRFHHALLMPLFAVLAVLLGLAESASGAFNPAATEPHYGNFLPLESEAAGRFPLQLADPVRGNGEWVYDCASGVPVYVRQNPWTRFDPLGLWEDNAHLTKWRNMAADENRNAFVRIGASFMATGEALNPFRSDSNLRQGAQQFQQGMAEGRENMKAAPPGVRHIGQFAMGMGSVGAAPLTSLAGVGELGDSVQQVGPVQTVKNMGTGFVTHIKETPVSELAGEALGGWATGKAMMGNKTARMTQADAQAEAGRVFWSGSRDAKAAAEAFAKESGGTTLEMTRTGKILDKITSKHTYPLLKPLWDRASASFAKGASGPVDVFHSSKGVRLESVWATKEYPVLLEKGNKMNYHVTD